MNNFSSVCVLIAFSYMLLWPARHVRTNKVERERAWFEIIMRQNFLSFFFTAFLNCKFSRNLIICVRAFFTFVLRARASQHIRIIKIYFVFFFQKKKKEKKNTKFKWWLLNCSYVVVVDSFPPPVSVCTYSFPAAAAPHIFVFGFFQAAIETHDNVVNNGAREKERETG